MSSDEKKLRELLSEYGIDTGSLFSSDTLTEKERVAQLASVLADIIKNQSNNSTKINSPSAPSKKDCFYLGFVSDVHSKLYLLEEYFNLLNAVDGKCVITGDMTNGSNHFNGHDSSLTESRNITDDILASSDALSRYKNMFIGYVEGNHDQWITEGTSLLVGHLACKIAKVDEIYAKNIQIVEQKVTAKDGKEIPFNFLLVHGENMPADVVKALKRALTNACGENVDAVIFGHTHKMGSANTTVISRNSRGEWVEKRVSAYNPGSLLEASDYADKAGYRANSPFDGTIMRCSVVKNENGKGYKKCIDIENIMDLVSNNHRDMLSHLRGKLSSIEKTKFASKEEIFGKYRDFREVYLDEKQTLINATNNNGHYIVSINGTADMFSPEVDEDIRNKVRENLKQLVDVVEKLPNVSVVLNGDLIYDYNKGYINKKDYCSDFIADIQDLCEILKPIADKIVVINNGKMEKLIMDVERDKGNGRLGNLKNKRNNKKSGKSKDEEKMKELAKYAVNSLQLDAKQAYAKYDATEMHNLQVAAQNDQVTAANQDIFDKVYASFMAKLSRDPNHIHELDGFIDGELDGKDRDKKIKAAIAEQLKISHEILDITNPEDRKKIDELFPLSDIDLRMPNPNLIGNIFCKVLGITPAKVKVNNELGCPAVFKFKDGDKIKTGYAVYSSSLPGLLRELPAKLGESTNPPEVVVVNNSVTKTMPNQEEYTTQIRANYRDGKNVKRMKDVCVINSGGFSYGRCMENGRISSTMLYKVADVGQIFPTLIPRDSVNYPGSGNARQVVEKYNVESVLQNNNVAQLIIDTTIKQSLKKALELYDQRNAQAQNEEIIVRFDEEIEKISDETSDDRQADEI